MTEPLEADPGVRVRPYAMTGGRTRAAAGDLPLETLIRATAQGQSAMPRLQLERKQIMALCTSPLSIAEISAHLRIPLGVARVLVGDMHTEGLLETNQPQMTRNDRPDIKLLERVLDGLQAL